MVDDSLAAAARATSIISTIIPFKQISPPIDFSIIFFFLLFDFVILGFILVFASPPTNC